jgi:hypothetical protein
VSKFIKLTPTSGDQAYYVLASSIDFVGLGMEGTTFVQAGNYVQVSESPEQVIKLIEDASEDREAFVEATANGLSLSFPVKSVSWLHETQDGKAAIKLVGKEVTIVDQSYTSLMGIKTASEAMSKVTRTRRIRD